MAGNIGFKGTRLEITEVTVTSMGGVGALVRYRVLFSDPEGIVHAQSSHEVTVEGNLAEPTKRLLEACKAHAARAHFDHPEFQTKEATSGGIAEALHGASVPADEPGTQG